MCIFQNNSRYFPGLYGVSTLSRVLELVTDNVASYFLLIKKCLDKLLRSCSSTLYERRFMVLSWNCIRGSFSVVCQWSIDAAQSSAPSLRTHK